MANEKRIRANFTGGLVDDNPLTIGATTMTSNALQALQVIDATQHMVLVLDPDGYGGAPEIAYLTGHTGASSTATLLRGQEGSTARAHVQDTPWVHSATAKDFDGSTGGTGLIGISSYTPAADAATYTNTSTTMVDVDATNLAVTFTSPPSGKVRVVLNGASDQSSNAQSFYWGLREGTTTVSSQYQSSAGTILHFVSLPFLIAGVTAGPHTYKWCWKVSGGTQYLYGGPTFGNYIMEVWAVNL